MHDVVDDEGLVEDNVLDVMQFRIIRNQAIEGAEVGPWLCGDLFLTKRFWNGERNQKEKISNWEKQKVIGSVFWWKISNWIPRSKGGDEKIGDQEPVGGQHQLYYIIQRTAALGI